jgi:YD repeat-containing protein
MRQNPGSLGLTGIPLTAANNLNTSNRFDVLQTDLLKDGVLQSRLRTNFRSWHSNIVLPERVETSKGTNPLEERIGYHSYDDKGNPLQVSKKDGTQIVYIWGYNKTLPVAKIENVTYSQITSSVFGIQAASNQDNDRTTDTVATNGVITYQGQEGALRNALKNLRNSLPTNALMTSFTYDPLIGTTSITDPRGRTIYYIYDSFNRLKYVKDHEGKVLSKTEYIYKN